MDEDFPFSFGNVSDSDDGSDGIFCPPKQQAPTSRMKSLTEQEPYQAQIDEDGWFHRIEKSIEELMMLKNGATKVKMRADHYYMLHQYQQAYEIAREYCRVVSSNGLHIASGDGGIRQPEEGTDHVSGSLKVTDSREMQEMALRCAIKLDMFDEAAKIADELTLQDSGFVFLKAKAYMAVGRHSDAAIGLVQYQKTRSSNFATWRMLAECLYRSGPSAKQQARPQNLSESESAPESPSSTRSRVTAPLALISILRARYLMRASNWTQVSYAQARYNREMEAIESERLIYEQECGLYQSEEADRLCGGDRELDKAHLETRYDLQVIKPVQECLGKMKEGGLQQLDVANGSIALEVVDFVVSLWDPRTLTTTSVVAVEDAGEVSVRSK